MKRPRWVDGSQMGRFTNMAMLLMMVVGAIPHWMRHDLQQQGLRCGDFSRSRWDLLMESFPDGGTKKSRMSCGIQAMMKPMLVLDGVGGYLKTE